MRWQYIVLLVVSLVAVLVVTGLPIDEVLAQSCRRNGTCG